MGLFRLLAIAFLIYLGYRILSNMKREKKEKVSSAEDVDRDVLVEDPVCKKLVPRRQAVVLEENGERLYFCSKECYRKYRNKGE